MSISMVYFTSRMSLHKVQPTKCLSQSKPYLFDLKVKMAQHLLALQTALYLFRTAQNGITCSQSVWRNFVTKAKRFAWNYEIIVFRLVNNELGCSIARISRITANKNV